MADEICIPTDRVPVDILNKLKEIGLLVQSESIPPRSLSSSSLSLSALPSSSFPSTSSQREHDECDNLPKSASHTDSVVHVLNPAVTSQETTLVPRGSDIVSVFATRPSPPRDVQTSFNPAMTSSQEKTHAQQPDDDVVSVFATRASHSKDAASQSAARQSQRSVLQLPQLHPSSLQSVPASCAQGGQQYATPSYPNYADVTDFPGAPSPYPVPPPPPSSPFKSLSGQEAEEERRLLHNRSPSKTSAKQRSSSLEHSQSPSTSEASSHNPSARSSSPPLSRSRSPPSQQSCSSADDNVVRVFPPRSATPSADVGQRSPKMLTPPETPESEGKRVIPEVFTFDDLTCTEERFRQTYERLCQLQGQITPTKRAPSTPLRHPSSTPPTPSYRRQEVPRSPSLLPTSRRFSPVDQRLMQCLHEAAAASSQQPKKPPSSPPAPMPMQRLSVEEYSAPQRRDSLSPKPKKRLDFEEEGVSSQMQRLRSYDASGAPYALPSPRASGSGSEGFFTFPGYSMDGGQQQFSAGRLGSGTPSKAALAMAACQERLASLAACYPTEGGGEEDDDDDRVGLFFAGARSLHVDLQNRIALQGGRFPLKRKRQEPEDDGSDDMAMCTCAVMEQNFLQMAECAYKRIRRLDNSPADFDRFRTELAQTNDILRESMGLMKHIRDICDHRKRPRW